MPVRHHKRVAQLLYEASVCETVETVETPCAQAIQIRVAIQFLTRGMDCVVCQGHVPAGHADTEHQCNTYVLAANWNHHQHVSVLCNCTRVRVRMTAPHQAYQGMCTVRCTLTPSPRPEGL